MSTRWQTIVFVLWLPLSLRADIYRWDTGEVIPGTEGVMPGQGARLDHRDLEYAALSNIDLSGANFEASNLTDARFGDANLSDANLTEANLTNADFSTEGPGPTLLTNANLTAALVTGTNFIGATGFTKEQLYSTASYQAKDLQGIYLSNSNLMNSDFSGQNLTNARFTGASLTNANLTGALVTGTDFIGATGFTKEQLYSTASYQAKDLQGIGLSISNLMNSDFGGQNLTNANFFRANLTDASLTAANLSNASLAGSTLTGANLMRATYNQWTVFPSFDPVVGGLTFVRSPAGDFDANGVLDTTDIDILTARIGIDGLLPYPWWLNDMFDLNGDSGIDLKDHHFWVTSLKQTRHGDTNLDGEVSFPDFVLLADNFGGAGGWGQGDFDADGQVQFADFVLLANNFGQGKTGDAAAVPEPDWAVLAFLGLVVLLIVTRMRQNRRGDPDSRQFNNSTIQQGDSRKWS